MKRLLFLIILLFHSTAFASAWLRQEGEIFLAPTFYYQKADKYYDAKGNKKFSGCDFIKREIQIYGEYGFNSNHTLYFKLPYDWLECDKNHTSGFGDLEVGVIRNLKMGPNYSLSAYGNIIVPTGYSIKDNPRIGYGKLGVEAGLLYGFSGKVGFWDSGIGYRYYFGYPSSQIRAYAGGGITLVQNLQLIAFLDAQWGLGDGQKKFIGENIMLEPDYKLIQFTVGPRIMFGKLSVVPGYQRTLYGRKVGDVRGIFFSLWYSF